MKQLLMETNLLGVEPQEDNVPRGARIEELHDACDDWNDEVCEDIAALWSDPAVKHAAKHSSSSSIRKDLRESGRGRRVRVCTL